MFKKVIIDIRKLRDYCLNPHHPIGKHKAKVFSSQLGMERDDAPLLKEQIQQKITNAAIEWGQKDEYGERFSADLDLNVGGKNALVKTIWIIRVGRKIPELVTCYIIT